MTNSFSKRRHRAADAPAARKPASMVLFSILLAGGLAACDAASNALLAPGESSFLVESDRKSVDITPDESTLNAVGETVQLEVRVTNGSGKVKQNPSVTWATLDPDVATVDANGLVKAVGGGTATITAFSMDLTDRATVVVSGASQSPPSVAAVTLTPASHSLQVGGTVQLTPVAKDKAGNTLERTFTWSAQPSGIASVSSSGVVTAISAGVVEVRAETDKVGEKSIITVSPAAVAPPPPPSGQYSPRSPHWSHIRLEVTDFRVRHQAASLQAAEYDWTAAHYDVVMDGPARAYKSRNPAIQVAPYQIVLAFMQTAQRGDIDALDAWYADPAKNTGGWQKEDAFLHRALPKDPTNRITYSIWGSARWAMNAGDPGFRAFITDRIRSRIYADADYPADGIFIDEHDPDNIDRARGAVEYPNWTDFHAAIEGLWQYVRPRLDGKYIQLNTAEYAGEWPDRWIIAAGQVHLEYFHHARREVWRRWDRVDRLVAAGVTAQIVGGNTLANYNKLSDTEFSAGNHKTKGGRGKMFELASYYMVRPGAANIDKVRFTNLNTWTEPFSTQWLRAYETDVGHPREARRIYASGTDPSGLPYRIYRREYDKALVLARSVLEWDQQDRCSDATAVPVALPAGPTWHMLYEDGNLGSTSLTSVTIRNCEAVILMKG